MPTKSSCSNAADEEFYLQHESWPMPPVNSSSCPQLAHSLPGVSAIPGASSVLATICYYYPSIQNYNGSVINGQLFETPVDDPIPMVLGLGRSVDVVDRLSEFEPCQFFCSFSDPCIVDNVNHKDASANFTDVPGGLWSIGNVKDPKQCLYGFSPSWHTTFQSSTLSAIILATDDLTNNKPNTCSGVHKNTAMVCPRTWWLNGIYNGGNASVASIQTFMKRGLDSLTSEIRSHGVDWDGNTTVAIGTSYETFVCIRLRWQWLIYPSAVVLSTLVLLLAVISCSGFLGRSKEVIWKGSILPFLFYGLGDGKRKGGTELEPESALKKAAKPMCVQLTSGEEGWRLHSS